MMRPPFSQPPSLPRNYGARICDDWRLAGYRAVVMENEALRITILADKGSDIVEFLYKPLDLDFMWRSHIPLRPIDAVAQLHRQPDGPFLDLYTGGWQDIFPSGGAACQHRGIAYGLHDESCNLAWRAQIIRDAPEEVACEFTVRLARHPIVAQKILVLRRGEPKLRIYERLINEADHAIELMWGHHIVLGAPFLSPDCRLDTPARRLIIHDVAYTDAHRFPAGAEFDWPLARTKAGDVVDLSRFEPAMLNSEDMMYLTDFDAPWYAVTDTVRRVSFTCRFSDPFRHLWYWQVYRGPEGYPWHRNAYLAGLEPWTSLPGLGLAEAVRRGQAVSLPARGALETELVAGVAAGLGQVSSIDSNGDAAG